MIFNSVEFVLFFGVVTVLYFALPHRFRWLLLLVASCYFYMAFVPIYILILGFTIVIDFTAGLLIEKHTGTRRKWFLIGSILANVGVLAIFKYYNFLNENLTAALGLWHRSNPVPFLSILLPIGLSFHTFQAMSYTIEVYRGKQKAERHFGIYALYVMFYPQLVAGPIERPQNVLHQFRERHRLNHTDLTAGLERMLWGFFKKLVVADRLSIYVDAAYNNPQQHSGLTLLVATVFFAVQIYCDFSGYSDIALGSARVMGFHLMENFRRPYFSRSVSEFWSRWHISLSTWFRDYVYIPLGGNRVSVPRWYINLFVVFVLSGLWHGANWTYLIWGALNGVYLVGALIVERVSGRLRGNGWSVRLPAFLQHPMAVLTTFALICFAWIFFRANHVSDAFLIINKIAQLRGPLSISNPSVFAYSLLSILLLFIYEAKQEYVREGFALLHHTNWAIRSVSYATLLILILLIGVFDGGQFIYFQF